MTFVALAYFGIALAVVAVAVAWCEWADRHERRRADRKRELAYRQAVDATDAERYVRTIRRTVNQPLGGEK